MTRIGNLTQLFEHWLFSDDTQDRRAGRYKYVGHLDGIVYCTEGSPDQLLAARFPQTNRPNTALIISSIRISDFRSNVLVSAAAQWTEENRLDFRQISIIHRAFSQIDSTDRNITNASLWLPSTQVAKFIQTHIRLNYFQGRDTLTRYLSSFDRRLSPPGQRLNNVYPALRLLNLLGLSSNSIVCIRYQEQLLRSIAQEYKKDLKDYYGAGNEFKLSDYNYWTRKGLRIELPSYQNYEDEEDDF